MNHIVSDDNGENCFSPYHNSSDCFYCNLPQIYYCNICYEYYRCDNDEHIDRHIVESKFIDWDEKEDEELCNTKHLYQF